LAVLELGETTAEAWHELWNELYHEGDVGEASYAAVPHLVRIYATGQGSASDTYSLVAMIELARHDRRNPDLPEDWSEAYEGAWQELAVLGHRDLALTDDPQIVSSILAVLAIEKRQPALGRFALMFSEQQRLDTLENCGRL
jgi:hypothetical protein